MDGILILRCVRFRYPIDRDVLDFVPESLLDQRDLSAFAARFAGELRALDLRQPARAAMLADYSEQIKQREHFDLYAENAAGFADYTLSPFIRATSARYVALWRAKLTKADARLLDIGCGTGIHSYPLIDKGVLFGFDISRKAVRKATEGARQRGLMSRSTFFVADGTSLPFIDESFEYVHTFGVLHHLPNPQTAIREIQRVLKPHGIHFAVENNRSAFRAIFDLTMRFYPLWIEEAGAQPMLSREMVTDWAKDLPVRHESETSVFLPPHLLNALGTYAIPLLDWSDRFFSHIPGWRHHGGQLVFTLQKL